MKRRELDRLLSECRTWKSLNEDERKMFTRAMRGRDFGGDALLDALEWYVMGWRGCVMYWQERESAAGDTA